MKTIMGKTFYSSLVAFTLLFTACGEEGSSSDSDNKSEYLPNSTKMTLTSSTKNIINEKEDHTEDSYKLAISKEGKYSINLKLLDGSAGASLKNIWAVVYDEDGNELIKLDELGVNEAGDAYEDKEFDVLITGNIYIKIGRKSNLDTNYKLNITK